MYSSIIYVYYFFFAIGHYLLLSYVIFFAIAVIHLLIYSAIRPTDDSFIIYTSIYSLTHPHFHSSTWEPLVHLSILLPNYLFLLLFIHYYPIHLLYPLLIIFSQKFAHNRYVIISRCNEMSLFQKKDITLQRKQWTGATATVMSTPMKSANSTATICIKTEIN